MLRILISLFYLLSATSFAAPSDLLLGKVTPTASAVMPVLMTSSAEISQLNQRLNIVKSKLAELENNPQAPEREMNRFWLTLETYAYQQHIAALVGLDLLQNQEHIKTKSKRASGVSSIQLQQERQLLEQEVNLLSSALKVQENYFNTIRDELEQAQAEQRLNQDQLEKTTPQTAQRTLLANKLALSQNKVETWLATLASIDARKQFTRTRLQDYREQIHALDQQIGNDQTKLQIEALDANLNKVQEQQQLYTQQQQDRLNREQQLRQQLADLAAKRTTLHAQIENPKANNSAQLQAELADLDPLEHQLLQQLETQAIQSGVLSDLMMANTLEATFWRKRQLLNINDAQNEIQTLNKGLQTWLISLREMLKSAQKSAGIAQDQIEQLKDLSDSTPEQLLEWQERARIYNEAATDLRHSIEKFDRWTVETSDNDQTLSMRTDYWQEKTYSNLLAIWHYELFSVQDSIEVDGKSISLSRGVTVGKMIIALLLITLGFAICIAISNFIERQLIKRSRFAPISVRIAKRWILSVAFIILLINSLLLVQIPLNAFAFLGGAIAIGLGFGMQTLLKNLISGLMMLVERPFRPGDLIEVAGIRGTIVDMNVRAAVVRDINGIDTMVPNSTFLEQNVTNWNHTTSIIRQGFQVGVAYGSDLRVVAKLLEEDVSRHGKISKDHAPEVLLEDFSADALTFGVYYWIDIGAGVIGRRVASDLRFMIDASFRKHNICIAFPQRDVHLDIAGPLRVQLETPTPENLESQRPNLVDRTGQ